MGIKNISIVFNNQKKREKKEAEEKVGLKNLLDEHEAAEFNKNLDHYGKFVTFTV
jgi:hypothetical protein